MKNWNHRITEARTARGMSKAELARECHVSSPTVTEWESGGIKNLDAANMLRICDVLRIDPWWLVLGKDKSKAPITEEKSPLSHEARKLISWVERLDGLDQQARKLFGHIAAALQVASSISQMQNQDRDADLAEAEEYLTSRTRDKPSEGPKSAIHSSTGDRPVRLPKKKS